MPILLALGVIIVVAVAVLFGRGSGNFDNAQRGKRIATVLMLGALVLLLIGFTQFRFLSSPASGTIVMVLDVSDSMSSTDVAPTRLQAAKEAALAFLDDLPSDLAVALVVFSGQAQVLAPPSTDRSVIQEALVGPPRGEGSTIGDAVDTALGTIEARWEAEGEGPSAVVVLTDGMDVASAVPLDAAVSRASDLGVRLYTVALGPVVSGETAAKTEPLAAAAAATDGGSFTAPAGSDLVAIYRTIRGRLVEQLAITDFGAWFVGAAALLTVGATIAVLYALRTERGVAVKKPYRVPRDVPRSRRPRTGRGPGARPRR